MTVSTRFAVPMLVLLLIALIPVAIYSTVTPSVDDCSQPEALLRVSEISSSTRLMDDMPGHLWLIKDRDFIQRIQGYAGGDNDASAFEFIIMRVYGLPTPFVHPTTFLRQRLEANLQRSEQLQVGSDQLPIHIDIQGDRFAAYFFIYDARPVKSPLVARLSGALQELVRGRRPLTSVLIVGEIRGRRPGYLPDEARDWLAAAWGHYRRVCAP
jgi:hypothetical protein